MLRIHDSGVLAAEPEEVRVEQVDSLQHAVCPNVVGVAKQRF